MPEQYAQSPVSVKQLKREKLKDIIKGAKTATGEKAAIVMINPEIDTNVHGTHKMQEETSSPAVFTYGRQQPLHKGHELVFNKVMDVASKVRGKPYVFTSHSQDEKKNPLSTQDKVKYIKKMVPHAEVGSTSKEEPSLLHLASKLHKAGHTDLHMVVGSDRAESMNSTLQKYNGVQGPHGYYNFKSITVHSAGHRDPDAEDTGGLSATKMRQAVSSGDRSTFRSGLPDKIKKHSDDIFNKVKSGMGLKEAIELYGFSINDLFESTALNRNWKKLSPTTKDKIIKVYTSDNDDIKPSSFKKFSQVIKKKIDEAKKSPWEKMLTRNPKHAESEARAQKAKDGLKQAGKDYQAILDREAAAKQKKVSESADVLSQWILSQWKNQEPVNYTRHLTKFFGKPDELTENRAVWYNVDGFKRIEILDEYVMHSSPSPHYDYVYCYIDLKVPHNLSNVLADSSESILLDHLKGEVGARCASLSANAVTIQYVMDVVEGNVKPSKKEYESRIKAMKKMFEDGKRYQLDWWPDVTKDTDPSNTYYEHVDHHCCSINEVRKGLWANIHAKRKRIKAGSGERMRKPGSEGAPTPKDLKDSQ